MKNMKFLPIILLLVFSLASQVSVFVSSESSSAMSSTNFSVSESLFSSTSSDSQITSQSPLLNPSETFDNLERIGPLLNSWLKEGKIPQPVNIIDKKKSIMLLTASQDPTLGGKINPVGHFELGNTGLRWIHAHISDLSELKDLIYDPSVIAMQADRDAKRISSKHDPFSRDISEELAPSQIGLDLVTDPVDAREILGINQIEQEFGYTGKDVVINVMDDGVDFGHTALYGSLALDKNNESASFDGMGYNLALSSLFSQTYYNDLIDDPKPNEAAKFGPLYKNGTGYVDTSDLDNLVIWDAFFGLTPASNYTLPWLDYIPIPDEIYVGNLPGNNTGYAFGIAAVLQSYFNVFEMILTPFVLSDSDENGDYDSLHIDYQTADIYTRLWHDNVSDTTALRRSNFNFTAFSPHQNHNNQYLTADIYTGNELPGGDGFNDISLGALGVTYDVQNVTGRIGNQSPMIRGIDISGEVFGYFTNTWGDHGTSVTGEIVARPIAYPLSTGEEVNVTGVAPDADIIGSYYLTDSSQIYSYLWSTGYEPDSNLEWTFANDHIANMSSNSWGAPAFELEGFSYAFDFLSLFMDLLSHPGYLDPNHPGILFVISSGNSGSGYGTVSSPIPGTALMVGASTNFKFMEYEGLGLFGQFEAVPGQGYDEVTTFSSSGPNPTNYPVVDVVNIGLLDFTVSPVLRSGENNATWSSFSGTSEAAPLTAGSMAVMYEAFKDINNAVLSPDQAKVLVKSTARDLGFDSYRQGNGRVDVERAVNQIVSGSVSGRNLYLIDTPGSYNNLGSRLKTAFANWFEGGPELNVSGYSGLDHPSLTVDYQDNNIYAGQISPGSSKTITIDITGSLDTVSALTYNESFSKVNPTTYNQNKNITYFSLDSLFGKSNYQNAEFVQVSMALTKGFDQRNSQNALPLLWIGTHEDTNMDGILQQTELQLYDLNINSNNVYTFFISSNVTQKEAYIGVHDIFFDAPQKNEDLSYKFSLRAFERIPASHVSVAYAGGNSYDVTFSPPSDATPGFYEGVVMVSGVSGGYGLAPYSYSVFLEVEDYATSGWSVMSETVNKPYDNAIYGVVDFNWRFTTGDWRFYDLRLSGSLSATNTLGIEIEWTYPNTVLDVYIVDNAGQVITTSDVDYAGAGRFNSRANSPPTIQRFLVNLTDYRLGNTLNGGDFSSGYNVFSVVLHAVKIDSNALPYDPIKVRAAWVTETVSDFSIPTPQIITTGTDTYQNNPVTTDMIGIEWTEVTTNPIPSFNTSGQEANLEIIDFLEFNREETIPSSELVAYAENNRIEAERVWEISLSKGMSASAVLSWPDEGTDFDFLLIPKGDDITFANDVFGAQLATSSNPERGEASIPETGVYLLVVEWYSGNVAQDQEFDLEFFAGQNIFSTSSSSLTLSTSLVSSSIGDGSYFMRSRLTGWNFPNKVNSTFIYDTSGPTPKFNPYIPESKTSGNFKIGTISDAVEYNYTISKDGSILTSGENVNGIADVSIDATGVTGVAVQNTFRLVGEDALGRTTDMSFDLTRRDDSDPVFLSTPNDEISAEQNKEFIVTYEIDDSTSGTYSVAANGLPIGDGNWQPETELDISLNFDEINSYIVVVTFDDSFGNSADHSFKVIVREATSEPTGPTTTEGEETGGGFLTVLPISLSIVTIATVVLIRRRRKNIS